MTIVKVYGPYSRKEDKRKVVVLRMSDGSLTTKSYARFLYEQSNGEIGDINLTVDHIDEDVTNDTLDNFQLLTRSDNIIKAGGYPLYKGFCPQCGNGFTKRLSDVRGNIKKGKAGPFCSRYCAGKRNAYM